MKVQTPSMTMGNWNTEKQRYFQTAEKLNAIARVKAGERHYTVAHSLGITGEALEEWITSLAPVDWSRGAGTNVPHDLLDRALYTWFIQQLILSSSSEMDLRPVREALRKKAEVFSVRLYGDQSIVSDRWIDNWQNRHGIQEKTKSEMSRKITNEVALMDDPLTKLLCSSVGKDNLPLFLDCDFDTDDAINSYLQKDQQLNRFYNITLRGIAGQEDRLDGVFKDINNVFEEKKNFPTEFRVGLLNTFGKEYGLATPNSPSSLLGSLLSNKSEPGNDVVHIGQKSLERQHLPPFGPIERKQILKGMELYALKADLLGVWVRANVEEKITSRQGINVPPGELFRVRFKANRKVVRVLSPKHLAYCTRPPVTLPVGTRVIAQYKDEHNMQLNALYAGIIAEPPKITNNQRYLIFFDDGYAQYVRHDEVYLVCESNKEVWKDIHRDSQEYFKTYLERYPERPMVKLQKKQVVKVEWNGQWWYATVLKVDASLVHVYFEADRRTEWIYRGSTRLAPLYNELVAMDENRSTAKVRRTYLKRKHQPYVEYTTGQEEPPEKISDTDELAPMARKHTKNTARKSTTLDSLNYQSSVDCLSPPNRGLPLSRITSQDGTTVTDKLPSTQLPHFTPHKCCPSCNYKETEQNLAKGQNPLRIPMICGWFREIVKQRGKRIVCYVTPCGRRLRNIVEVFKFLTTTRSKLPIDLFSYDFYVHTFSQFKPSGILAYIKDITYGKEPIPVCLVNNLDKNYPPPVAYSSKRFPREGVTLDSNPEFLCGCDCEDNCQNKAKCQCQQLTVQATSACHSGKIDRSAGYQYRRLAEPLFTAVYECNSRCKCKSTCLNRVVQFGLQVRLQVFKTEKRGWGIRCLDDLPQGIFICIYAGQVSNEEGAQVDGRECGDEYQAELDHIEVVEAMKEGYESDMEDIEGNNSDREDESDGASEEEAAAPKLTPRNKSSAYESDRDYDPPSSAKDSTDSAKRGVRASSKDSDSSGISSDMLYNSGKTFGTIQNSIGAEKSTSSSDGSSNNPNWSQYRDGKNDFKNALAIKEGTDDGYKSANSADTPSRKKSSAAIGASEYGQGATSKEEKPERHKPLRSYFGEEYCYIMDAKKCGNIGRYLNHSCNPNVFVQNVFVDTHDLRFPWVAFFASVYIRAGTELTWDYNYDVGSVPGKVLHCYCGAKECRRRLL